MNKAKDWKQWLFNDNVRIATPSAQPKRGPGGHMEVREALALGRKALSGKSEQSSRDAVLLLSHALNCRSEEIYVHPERIVTAKEYDAYITYLKRRAENEPMAYLLGYKDFMGRKFKVDRRVLIPRPETEILVETALHLAKDRKVPVICDVCCGSGAVGLSILERRFSCLLRETEEAREPTPCLCFLTDISSDALEVARENAKMLVPDQIGAVHFLQGDGLEPLRHAGLCGKVDMIVSNPPYIPKGEIENLAPEIKDFEPRLALDGGDDGAEFIRMLVNESPSFLKPGGYLLIEIGYGQVESCKEAVFRTAEDAYEGPCSKEEKILSVCGEWEPETLLSPPHLTVKTRFYAPQVSPWLRCWTVCDYAGIERVFVAAKKCNVSWS